MNKIFVLLFVFIFSFSSAFALLRDEIIEESLADKNLNVPYSNLNYNYESIERIPIKLNITENISTKKDEIYDGQILNFIVKDNVFLNNQLFLKKGTPATAEVVTYITRGMNGTPATIILDNFKIKDIPQEKLKCTILKKGLNLALLVFPIKWALTPIPFVGSLTNFIIGGHAKIKKKHTITIYYYPNWVKNI